VGGKRWYKGTILAKKILEGQSGLKDDGELERRQKVHGATKKNQGETEKKRRGGGERVVCPRRTNGKDVEKHGTTKVPGKDLTIRVKIAQMQARNTFTEAWKEREGQKRRTRHSSKGISNKLKESLQTAVQLEDGKGEKTDGKRKSGWAFERVN